MTKQTGKEIHQYNQNPTEGHTEHEQIKSNEALLRSSAGQNAAAMSEQYFGGSVTDVGSQPVSGRPLFSKGPI